MKKKLTALLLSMTVVMSLTACGSQQKAEAPKEEAQKTEEVADAVQDTAAESAETGVADAEVTFAVGYSSQGENAVTLAIKEWKNILEEKSGGTMTMELYLDGSLGSQGDVINGMQLGEKNITVADGALLAEYGAPDLGILFAPYLFTDWDQVWKLVESDWFKGQNDLLRNNGLTMIAANWALGERNLCLVNPVEHPADLAGRKIRVPDNQIQIEGTNAIGATATPLSMADVYQSLETKMIDGCENVNDTLLGMHWCEVGKYVYEDNHIYNMAIWICSSDVFDSLTEEQQNWLVESAEEAGLFNNQKQEEMAEGTRQTMIDDYGVTFIECTPEDKAELVSMCESFYANGSKFGWSDGLYETVKEAIQ